MIAAVYDKENDITTFGCPNCGAEDVAYTSAPHRCFHCRGIYNFNIEDLCKSRAERTYFHKNGITLKFAR